MFFLWWNYIEINQNRCRVVNDSTDTLLLSKESKRFWSVLGSATILFTFSSFFHWSFKMFSTVAFCYFLSIILLFSSTVWAVASKPDGDVQMSLDWTRESKWEVQREDMDGVHYGHFKEVKCVRRAKSSVYWPGCDDQIRNILASCANFRTDIKTLRHRYIRLEFQIIRFS